MCNNSFRKQGLKVLRSQIALITSIFPVSNPITNETRKENYDSSLSLMKSNDDKLPRYGILLTRIIVNARFAGKSSQN